jgi:Holliday junction resolvasome RuvABC endonuclease subunit
MPGFTSSYIGIDQSLRSTGIAAVTADDTACGLIEPPDNMEGVLRLAYIRNQAKAFLTLHGPCLHACVEGPSHGSTNRGDDLGQLRGVLILSLHDWGVPTTVIAPTTLKKFGGRSGSASKSQMIKTAQEAFDIELGTQDDLADALWLAQLARALNEDIKLTRPQLEVVYGIRNPKPKKTVTRTPRVLDV